MQLKNLKEMSNNKVEVWDLEEPVPCPECGEWHELQSSKPSINDPDRLICPECFEAEKRSKKEEIILDDITDQELEGIEEVECQHFVNRSDGGGRCGNKSRGFVKFITDKGAACELYVCKMHYKVLTEKLEKNNNIYNSEIR